jgi:hypothetical protein
VIRRLAAALALVAIGIFVPVAPAPAPAHAARWAEGPCTDNVGITIVIDFQELDGGVNVRCAPGPVTSGLDALDQAGIVWEGTRRFPGVVCRIAGKPGAGSESCVNTPPATAYWSYWVAPRGGPWCYSTAGAGNRTPPPGTIEGWSFALGRVSVDIPPPRFAPPAAIPGEAPNPLNGADCGSPAATPNPPAPTPAPTIPPPAPTNAPASPAAPQTSTVLAEPDSASTVVTTPPQQAAGGPTGSTTVAANAAGSTSTTGPGSAVVTTSSGVSTTRPTTASTGALDQSSSANSIDASGDTSGAIAGSVPLGTVDLGDDGRGDGGFSPAAGLGLLIAAGVGGTSVWAARRRRGMPP